MTMETLPGTVTESWQILIEEHLEHGAVPLIGLGSRDFTAESLPALQAIGLVEVGRGGLGRMDLAVGGDGVYWLAAWFQQRTTTTDPRAGGITRVRYTGPDLATHLAGYDLMADPARSLDLSDEAPAAFQWMFNPARHPGAVGPWEWLWASGGRFLSDGDGKDGFLAYLGLLLVVALLATAAFW